MMRLDHRRMRGDERAGHAGRLAERAHVDDALAGRRPNRCERCRVPRPARRSRARRRRRARRRASRRDRAEPAQRRDVAVHAEHRVGGDQLARRASTRRAARSAHRRRDADSARGRRAASSAPSLRQAWLSRSAKIASPRPTSADQDREVGEVPGGTAAARAPSQGRDERGEFALERRVRRLVPADEVRRAGAHAPADGAVAGRGDQRGSFASPR